MYPAAAGVLTTLVLCEALRHRMAQDTALFARNLENINRNFADNNNFDATINKLIVQNHSLPKTSAVYSMWNSAVASIASRLLGNY